MQYTINTSAGFFTIRGLKHREVKEIYFRSQVDHTGAESEKLQDDILLKIIGEDERLGELVEYERIMLFSKIIDLTFMTEDQRKNYNWQWASTIPEASDRKKTNDLGNLWNMSGLCSFPKLLILLL